MPERLVGFGRRSRSLQRDVIVAIDQSASMADSVVYASVFGAVLAGIPALRTQLVAFDTAVVDLSELLDDPVDVLFGVQLGGGTDIGAALAYCRQLVTRPRETMLIVVTDLFDGGPADRLHALAADLVGSGVTLVVLLSLSDEGTPTYRPVAGCGSASTGGHGVRLHARSRSRSCWRKPSTAATSPNGPARCRTVRK